jgi:2-(1,2-epoxy-1,2-dihydrophenyl)acetyl-CoA isomerase
MNYSRLIYSADDNRVATITLNVPNKLNALDAVMINELASALQTAAKDERVKVVVLTGEGKAFCAGGDMTYFKELDLAGAVSFIRSGQALINSFVKTRKPIIAAVNGFAVGAGLSLTLLSDMVISSDQAVYGAAFINIGVIPDLAQLYFLPKIVGLQKAKELSFLGANFDAREAHRLGIVNLVVEHDQFADAVRKMSLRLAAQPGAAMGYAKTLLNMSMDVGLDELAETEAMAQGICMVSDDAKEGVDAFLHKRKPDFK